MMEHAARAQKWMLRSAPILALAGVFGGAGGAAAALALWLGFGLLLTVRDKQIKQYPKQRRMKLHRLFLGYSFCVFCLFGLDAAGRWLLSIRLSPVPRFLFSLGCAGLSLPLGAWAMQWHVRKRFSFALAFIFCILSAALYFSNPIQPK
ncbi:MAG: hypothetical protein IKH57_19475 [Clostridia bacterium]|nr:hypothetical protein [Clostridia bacterium]